MSKQLKDLFFNLTNVCVFIVYLLVSFKLFPYLFNRTSSSYMLFQNHSFELINLSFKLDQLSAFFAIIISGIAAVVTLYFIKYADEYSRPVSKLSFDVQVARVALGNNSTLGDESNKIYSRVKLTFATHLFIISMLGVVLADHAFCFLFFWELMSLCSYLLVIYDHRQRSNVNAGFIYFITTHIAVVFLLIAFLLVAGSSSDLSFTDLANSSLSPALIKIAFFMFLIGAGIKAGLVPFHFWLPVAHPVAPSHVSALMSGLMVKTPIYLLLRVIFDFFKPEAYMGYSMLALGLASALLGIVYAVKENDIKKLLAYSTIENVGIIFTAIALAVIFYVHGAETLAALALIAALFHCLNHAIYKSALFMGAGSIVGSCHSKDLNQLGGLIKTMPKTAIVFLIATMSIAALPLFNGFISEWLIYQSLIQGMQIESRALTLILPTCVTLIAIVAGFAFIAFSKLFATAFLGYPRSEKAAAAKEVSPMMWAPIALLSSFCIVLGLMPQMLSPIWLNILHQFNLLTSYEVVEFNSISGNLETLNQIYSGLPIKIISIAIVVVLIVVFVFRKLFANKLRKDIPWVCGYDLKSQAQYNASSFSQPSLRIMKRFYQIDFAHIFLGIHFGLYNLCKNIRDKVHSGDLHTYLLYILIAIIGGLCYAKLS